MNPGPRRSRCACTKNAHALAASDDLLYFVDEASLIAISVDDGSARYRLPLAEELAQALRVWGWSAATAEGDRLLVAINGPPQLLLEVDARAPRAARLRTSAPNTGLVLVHGEHVVTLGQDRTFVAQAGIDGPPLRDAESLEADLERSANALVADGPWAERNEDHPGHAQQAEDWLVRLGPVSLESLRARLPTAPRRLRAALAGVFALSPSAENNALALAIARGFRSPVEDVEAAEAWTRVLGRLRGHLSRADADALARDAARWRAAFERGPRETLRSACSGRRIRRRAVERCRRALGLHQSVSAALYALERGSADPEPLLALLHAFPDAHRPLRTCRASEEDDAVSAAIEHEALRSDGAIALLLDRPRCIHARNTGRLLRDESEANGLDAAILQIVSVEHAEPRDGPPRIGDPVFDDAPLVVVSWRTSEGPPRATSYLRKVGGRWRVVHRWLDRSCG